MDSMSFMHYFESRIVVIKVIGFATCSAHFFTINQMWHSGKSEGETCFANGRFPPSFLCHRQCQVSVVCSEGRLPWVKAAPQRVSTHKCLDGAYIPMAWVCDSIQQDCRDGKDEHACNHVYVVPNDSTIMLTPHNPFMYDQEKEFNDHYMSGCNGLYFTCPTGGCVPLNTLCDGYINCNDNADEILCRVRNKEQNKSISQIQNVNNSIKPYISSVWFNVTNGLGYFYRFCDDSYLSYSELCVYDPDHNLDIDCYIPLREKCRYISCPWHFKCHDSFCIPIHRVCDGLADCLYGDDESSCSKMTCKGLFQCRNESYCVPPWEVCDGMVHCPQWRDDELYCNTCPVGCQCHGNAVLCTQVTADMRATHLQQLCQHQSIKALIYISSQEDYIDHICHQASILYLVMQNVKYHLLAANRVYHFTALRYLDLIDNTITMIPSSQLSGCTILSILNLAYNKLQIINDGSFAGLDNLHTLILSNNEITTIHENVFFDTPVLQKLFIEMNKITALSADQIPPFDSLTVLTSDYDILCCFYVSAQHCSPAVDVLSLCYNLLGGNSRQTLITFQCFTIIFMNTVSVCWNLRHPNVEIVQLFNLNVADLFMGLSLFSMLSFNFWYTNMFMDVVLTWKEHWVCYLSATLNFLSLEGSMLITTCMLLQRIANLKKMKTVGLNSKSIMKNIMGYTGLWLICSGICTCLLIIRMQTMINTEYGSSLCFVIDPFSQVLSTKMYPWIGGMLLIILNTVGVAIMGFSYIFLSKILWYSFSVNKLGVKKPCSFGFVKIAILLFSLLWTYLPFITVYILALGAYEVDKFMATWILIMTMPLSSLLNPFVNMILPLTAHLKKLQ
jgi:hypothetical protein